MNTPICARILIPKYRIAISTNYPSVTKDQALEETVLTLFHHLIQGYFELVDFTIQLPVTMSSKANSQKQDWKV